MKSIVWAIAAALTLLASGAQAQTTIADLKPPADISDAEQDARMDEIDALLEQAQTLLEEGRDPLISDKVADYGKVNQAVVIFEKALSVSETWFGEGPYTAMVLNHLAFGYVVAGQTDKAVAAYERAVMIRTILYGADDPALITTYVNLGYLYTDSGRLTEAELRFQSALRCADTGDNEDRALVPGIFGGIAELYDKMGRTADAAAARTKATKAN